jgi:hypothetical protein
MGGTHPHSSLVICRVELQVFQHCGPQQIHTLSRHPVLKCRHGRHTPTQLTSNLQSRAAGFPASWATANPHTEQTPSLENAGMGGTHQHSSLVVCRVELQVFEHHGPQQIHTLSRHPALKCRHGRHTPTQLTSNLQSRAAGFPASWATANPHVGQTPSLENAGTGSTHPHSSRVAGSSIVGHSRSTH